MKSFLISFLLFSCWFSSTAQVSVRIPLADETISVPSTEVLKVQDQLYPNVSTGCYVKSAKAIVTLGFDLYKPNAIVPATASHTVRINISYNKADGSAAVVGPLDLTVTNSTSGAFMDEKSYVVIPGAYSVSVDLVSINGAPGNFPAYLFLESTIDVDRYYPLDLTTVPFTGSAITKSYNPATNELDISWADLTGATSYELEYTYVDDYAAGTLLSTIPAEQLTYDFAFNSTRVVTEKLNYSIPVIYDRGYLLYRLRAKGKGGASYNMDVNTKWSSEQFTTGTVLAYTDKYAITGNVNTNWQFMATFAEEGKRKDVVSFYDGSLRNRQVVTKSNSINKVIAGETIYDGEGRGVITTLPVPVATQKLEYISGLNKNSNDVAYSKADFDVISCDKVGVAMSTTSGSSLYYSPSNPYKTNEKALIPNANGYAFSQTEFLPDNTGRIKKQSGVGANFKIGSTHETKYFYAKPKQEELDRLFGTNAGQAVYYKKNVVIDPNGQASVSYIDLAGKVVATALAGEATPTGMDAVEGPDRMSKTVIFKSIRNCGDGTNNCNTENIKKASSLEFSEKIVITAATPYTLDYHLAAEKFTPALCTNLCYDCVYDLEIGIQEECGSDIMTPIIKKIGSVADIATCGTNVTDIEQLSTLSLPIGTYTVYKRLKVNEEALLQAYQHYLINCATQESVFIADALNAGTLDNACKEVRCDDCLASFNYNQDQSDNNNYESYLALHPTEETPMTKEEYLGAVEECKSLCNQTLNNCDASYQMMLGDVAPNGQYGCTHPDSLAWNVSVYNVNNSLPGGVISFYRNPVTPYLNRTGKTAYIPVEVTYEENGVTIISTDPPVFTGSLVRVDLKDDGVNEYYVPDANGDMFAVLPQNLATLAEFTNRWIPGWAASLVNYHPEYCYYNACVDRSMNHAMANGTYSSNDFDDRLQLIEHYADAILVQPIRNNDVNQTANGLYNPRMPFAIISAGSLSETIMDELLNKDPYFTTGSHSEYKTQMRNSIVNYKNSGLNIVDYTSFASRCGNIYYANTNTNGPKNPGSSYSQYGCFNFGGIDASITGTTTEIAARQKELVDSEWMMVKSMYLSEKQKIQQYQSDYACSKNIAQNGNHGVNHCIGNTDFTPYKVSNYIRFMYSFGSINWLRGTYSTCGIDTYRLYANKTPRFMIPAHMEAMAGICDLENIDESIAKAGRKADMELYLETGQCPLTRDFQTLFDDMASRGNFVVATPSFSDYSLLRSKSVTKLLYDNLVYGGNVPTNPAPSAFTTLEWELQPATATPETVRSFKINIFEGSTLANINFTVLPNQTYTYLVGTEPNTSIPVSATVDLNFLATPAYKLKGSTTEVRNDGRYLLITTGLKNIIWLNKTNVAPFINNFRATVTYTLFDVFLDKKVANVSAKISGSINTGNINTNLHGCETNFTDVCGLTDEMTDIAKLLEAIAAKKHLASTNVVMNTDPAYNDLLTPILIKKFGISSASQAKFSTSGTWPLTIALNTDNDAPYLTITLAFTGTGVNPITNVNNIVGFSCLKYDEENSNKFIITASYINGAAINTVSLIGTYTATNPTFAIRSCGPLVSASCKSTGSLNALAIPKFLTNIADINELAFINNSEATSLKYNSYFVNQLKPQLGANVDYEFGGVVITGSNLTANICPATQNNQNPPPGGAANCCKLKLSFGSNPDNVTFAKLVAFGNLKAGYSATTGGKTTAFTIVAYYYDPSPPSISTGQGDGVMPVDAKLKSIVLSGNSCFEVEKCEIGCSPNMIENGDFEDPTVTLNNKTDGTNNVVPSGCALNQQFENFKSGYFVTDYSFQQPMYGTQQPGNITILQNSNEITSYPGSPALRTVLDHTTKEGHFLFVDGSNKTAAGCTTINYYDSNIGNGLPDANLSECGLCRNEVQIPTINKILIDRVWYRSVTVTAGNTYEFKAYINNLDNGPKKHFQSLRTVGLFIVNTGFLTTGITQAANDGWDEITMRWVAPEPLNGGSRTYTIELDVAVMPYAGNCSNAPSNCDGRDIAIDDISFRKICEPDYNFVDPVAMVDDCHEYLTNVITANAKNAYLEYERNLAQEFRTKYTAKCLSALETLSSTYVDTEFHYTLYYYDQSGNLVKTIPPVGVKPANATDLDAIFLDRYKNTFTYSLQPQHKLATTYAYNSLNQLTSQIVPDHDLMKVYDATPLTNIPADYTVQGIQFKDGANGYMIASDLNHKAHAFVSSDGGKTWNEQSKIGITDLKDVQIVNANLAYAVGSDGALLKTIDNDMTNWIFKPVGTSHELFRLNFTGIETGAAYERDGTIWTTMNGGTDWASSSALKDAISIGNGNFALTDVSFKGNNVFAVASDGAKSKVYKSDGALSTWTEVTFKTSDLHAVEILASGTGFAAGINGILLKTTNSGVNWSYVPNNLTTETISQLHFNDGTYGSAIIDIGSAGKRLYQTSDGGATWKVIDALKNTSVTSWKYLNTSKTGYAIAGKKVYKTLTGGQSWMVSPELHDFSAPENASALLAVDFLDANNGMAALTVGTATKIFFSSNAGNSITNWTEKYTIDPVNALSNKTIKDLHFFTNTSGIALVATGLSNSLYNISINTSNNKITFTPGPAYSGITRMKFFSTAEGVVYNDGGQVYKVSYNGTSVDYATFTLALNTTARINDIARAGTNYISVCTLGKIFNGSGEVTTSIAPPLLATVAMNSATTACVGGKDGSLFTYNNTSNTFHPVAMATNADITAIAYSSANTIVSGSATGKFYSNNLTTNTVAPLAGTSTAAITRISFDNLGSDGFATLADGSVLKITGTTVTAKTPPDSKYSLNDIHFFTNGTGLVVGANGKIFKTATTQASSWTSLTELAIGSMQLNATYMVKGTDVAYSVGKQGSIIKSVNGGKTWDALKSGTAVNLKALCFKDIEHGIVVGEGGTVLITTDGGKTWTPKPVTATVKLNAIDIRGGVVLMVGDVAGTSGAIFRSTNFGTLSAQVHTTTFALNAIGMVDQDIAYVAGNGGNILKTVNGGLAWNPLKNNGNNWTDNHLSGIHFTNIRTGYAVGAAGTLLKTVDAGATWDNTHPSGTTENITQISFIDDNHAFLSGTTLASVKMTDYSDEFSSRFWYDELGRLIVSQNSKQFATSATKHEQTYSYSCYDELGRITEVGEVEHSEAIENRMVKTQLPYTAFTSWLVNANAAKTEVTKSYYDNSTTNWTEVYPGFTQQNLRKRIVKTEYYSDYSAVTPVYDHASHYSYDEHGNVKTLIQDVPYLRHFANGYKRMDYDYDLISGKVNKLTYQPSKPDQFIHRYEYDADNRLTNVYTSKDDIVWAQDATYKYYDHGPLARTEIGDYKVQAMDYAYTIQGWIKGVNANNLDPANDPGHDGGTGLNKNTAKDAFSYTLGYYTGDYSSIGASSFESSITGSGLAEAKKDLYNGNISHMVTTILNLDDQVLADYLKPLPQAAVYVYDQLNRIKEMQTFANLAGNVWGTDGAGNKYKNQFTYDANGNILTQVRYDASGTLLDDLKYQYDWYGAANAQTPVTSLQLRSNRLYHVNEAAPETAITDDIEDQGTVNLNPEVINSTNNYTYDQIGNLVKDNSEQIEKITWNASGKITEVIRTAVSGKADLAFVYDATGNRIAKISKPHASLTDPLTWTTTWYMRDASGNVMSTYKQSQSQSTPANYALKLTEQHVFGSSRLGLVSNDIVLADRPGNLSVTYTPAVVPALSYIQYLSKLGNKNYELSNHLGNVLTTVTDYRKVVDMANDGTIDSYAATVDMASDYYPFGAQMGGRNWTSRAYRYGFNGQERDDDNGGDYDFGARIYDPRIGRWMSIDPSASLYPSLAPYSYVNNNPIKNIEIDGKTFGDVNVVIVINDHQEKAELKVMGDWQVFRVNSLEELHNMPEFKQIENGSVDNLYFVSHGYGFKSGVSLRSEDKGYGMLLLTDDSKPGRGSTATPATAVEEAQFKGVFNKLNNESTVVFSACGGAADDEYCQKMYGLIKKNTDGKSFSLIMNKDYSHFTHVSIAGKNRIPVFDNNISTPGLTQGQMLYKEENGNLNGTAISQTSLSLNNNLIASQVSYAVTNTMKMDPDKNKAQADNTGTGNQVRRGATMKKEIVE